MQHDKTPMKKDGTTASPLVSSKTTSTSPTSVSMEPNVKITAEDLLKYSEIVYEKKVLDQRRTLDEDQTKMMGELRKKHEEAVSAMRLDINRKRLKRMEEAREEQNQIEKKIKEAYPNKTGGGKKVTASDATSMSHNPSA